MRRLIAILFTASIWLDAGAQELDRSVFIRLAASLVKIEALSANGTLSLGTGVTIAPGRVATNCHVTRNAVNITMLRGGLRWRVAGQIADVAHDICLLRAPRLDAIPASRGDVAKLKLGQEVGAIGFEGGVAVQYRQGRISAMHQHDGSHVLRSSTPFTSGASGGGLFNRAGELVGLLTFRQRGTDGSYFSVPVNWIRDPIEDDEKYAPIAPLNSNSKAFWQHTVESLPYFMQANSLAVDQKWVALLQLTNRWSAAETTSSEPWILQARAYDGLARPDDAVRCFEEALKRDPDSGEAWLGIGQIYANQGDEAQLRRAHENLNRLNPDLAAEFIKQQTNKTLRPNHIKSQS